VSAFRRIYRLQGLLIDTIIDMKTVPAFGHQNCGIRQWSRVSVRALHSNLFPFCQQVKLSAFENRLPQRQPDDCGSCPPKKSGKFPAISSVFASTFLAASYASGLRISRMFSD
jgi:hypothetical protein